MRRPVALALVGGILAAVVLALALPALTPDRRVEGRWEVEVELGDYINSALAAAGERARLSSFPVVMDLTFTPEGTYTLQPDQTAFAATQAATRDQLGPELSYLADALAGLGGEMAGQGNYRAQGGRLYLSGAPDRPVDREVYYTYALRGDTLSLRAGVGTGEEGLEAYFPLELKRLA